MNGSHQGKNLNFVQSQIDINFRTEKVIVALILSTFFFSLTPG